MFQAFLGYVKVLEGVPGFLEGVPGCSGFFSLFRVFRGVPVFRCSGVPVFRCSSVPPFLELLHAEEGDIRAASSVGGSPAHAYSRLVARGSNFALAFSSLLRRVPPAGILKQTELTLPPTLLAARGSNIALAFSPLLLQGF